MGSTMESAMDRRSLTRRERDRLERQLKGTRDARVYRRTLAVLEYHRGRKVAHIAAMLGVERVTVYRWLSAYQAAGDPEALEEGPHPGRPPLWTPECTQWLNALMGVEPETCGWEETVWTVPLLRGELACSTGHWFDDDTIRTALHGAGWVWKRGRYELEPDPEAEKKTLDPPAYRPVAARQRARGPGRNGPVAVAPAARPVGPARAAPRRAHLGA